MICYNVICYVMLIIITTNTQANLYVPTFISMAGLSIFYITLIITEVVCLLPSWHLTQAGLSNESSFYRGSDDCDPRSQTFVYLPTHTDIIKLIFSKYRYILLTSKTKSGSN